MVPGERVELSWGEAPEDFESSASASSATPAFVVFSALVGIFARDRAHPVAKLRTDRDPGREPVAWRITESRPTLVTAAPCAKARRRSPRPRANSVPAGTLATVHGCRPRR